MAMKRALSDALLGLTLGALAGCGESPVASGAEPVQHPPVASSVREAELAELPPTVTPLAETAHADTTRTPVAPVAPTFPGLAETPGGPAPRIADVELTLERTWCLGTCPVYTVRVSGDGTVRYEGYEYVMRTEAIDARIDPARLEPILRELEALDYLRHEHRCRAKMRDSPGTGVTLLVGKSSRRFLDMRSGRECGQVATSLDTIWHASVDRIGRLIDELVQSEQWIGTPGQRAALPRER
ncbi:MAG: DUF6438 domain-containing protein [Planctomycetota bacterium]|nr:DUF6438 domain-containing protein [Planctomycetota bacterium]